MEQLKQAVRRHADAHANRDGLALAPVPGLTMMRMPSPSGELHSVYRPLVCFVLQGEKRMTVGLETRTVSAGQTVIVSADMPVVGRIVTASEDAPYLAVAVELEATALREIAAELGAAPARAPAAGAFFAQDTEAAALDCVARLMRLIDRPEAIALLRPAIMRELHYWLLSGPHAAALRDLADPDGRAGRLGAAVAMLRAEFRMRLPTERLAEAAAMSLTAFHKHFKHMTSLTPGQYQKRLRLIEARRLMQDEGAAASVAALETGYESVSQFTRDYARLFGAPPKRDALRAARAQARSQGIAAPAS